MTTQSASPKASPAQEPLLDTVRIYLLPLCLFVGVITWINWNWHQRLDVHIKRTAETLSIAERIHTMNVHLGHADTLARLPTLTRYPPEAREWRFDRERVPWISGGTLYLLPDEHTPTFTAQECQIISRNAVVNHGVLYPDAPLHFRGLDTVRGGCLLTLP